MENRHKFLISAGVVSALAVAMLCGFAMRDNISHVIGQQVYATANESYTVDLPFLDGNWAYNSKKGRFENNINNVNTIFTLSWDSGDSSKFTIQIDDNYLNGTDGKLNWSDTPTYWSVRHKDDKAYVACNDTNFLSINSSYPYLTNYKIGNLGKYTSARFYTPDLLLDWTDRGCLSVKGAFAQTCLSTISY